MNELTDHEDNNWRDDIVGAIAVVVMLFGTASGNALVLLTLSLGSLILLPLICRGRLGRGSILIALVAAIAATVLGVLLAVR